MDPVTTIRPLRHQADEPARGTPSTDGAIQGRLQMTVARVSGRALIAVCALAISAHASAATPDLSGVWEVSARIQQLRTVERTSPPLRPAAAKVYAQHEAQWRAGDLSYDPTAKLCVAPGLPRLLYLPYPFQIIQRPDYMLYLFQWNHWNRIVAMTDKVDVPYPLVLGVAKAHWAGDTLVIDTDGLRPWDTFLDTAGMPHSDALHLTERLRLIDGGRRLEDRIRIEDPQTFTHPWETLVEFHKLPKETEIKEDTCLDRRDAGQPAVDWSRWH